MIKTKFNRYFSNVVKFSKNHIWLKFDTKSHIGKLGLTHFGQTDIGEIQHIELPNLEKNFQTNCLISRLETTKHVFNFLAPVPVKIISINKDIINDPRNINANAEETFIFEVQILDERQLINLLTDNEYIEYLQKMKLNKNLNKSPNRQSNDLEENNINDNNN